MAQSHIIHFLALAHSRYQETEKKSSIRLLEIPFNATKHGLPCEAENSDTLPYTLVLRLLEATSCLEQSFRKLLFDLVEKGGGEKPVCVVGDFFFEWMAHVTHEFGVFHAIFSFTGGFGMACYYFMW
ncbi:UDP-glycosyltransferase 92A1 [Forsythia ovata]|uniref:UDP-glycosyltransferase 92A1 n=1 Tax=Forsythia ovata TaxID=205694 RepID=A0ABD1UCY8_9LAMI